MVSGIQAAQTGLSRLAATSAWGAFREGLAVPWIGLRYMMRHPALWRYGVFPVLVNLLITGFLLILLIAAGGWFFVTIHPKFGEGAWWLLAEVLAAALVVVVVFGLAVVAWMVLQGILCGHFYGRLAEQVELQLGMRREEIKDVPFGVQVADTFRDVSSLILVNAGCLVVQIIPGLGTVVGLASSYYFTCFTLGLEYWEYPLALRGLRRGEMREFARRHRAQTLGLGTMVTLMALVPLVNAVLLTTAVTGAVLLHRRLAGMSVPSV